MSDSKPNEGASFDLAASKARMLEGLLVAVDRRRTRRQRRWRLAMVLAVSALAWSMHARTTSTPTAGDAGDRGRIAPEPVPPAIEAPWEAALVADDRAILRRLATATQPLPPDCVVHDRALDPEFLLDDPSLLEWLRRAGRPSGILRTKDSFQLTPIAQGD